MFLLNPNKQTQSKKNHFLAAILFYKNCPSVIETSSFYNKQSGGKKHILNTYYTETQTDSCVFAMSTTQKIVWVKFNTHICFKCYFEISM